MIGVGYQGVSFFFFLSGFILTYSHAAEYERGKGDAMRFWVARFARIYPVYLLSMIFAGYVEFGEFRQRIHILAYIADLLMVQSWSLRMTNFFHVTAWSLSNEVFFYLPFPFLLMRLRPTSAIKAYSAVVGFWLLAMLAPLIYTVLCPRAAWDMLGPGSTQIFRLERWPIFALPEFLAGVSLAWAFLRFRPSARLAAYLAPAGTVGLAIAFAFSDHFPNVMMFDGLFIPFYTLIVLGLSEPNWLSKLLSAPWLILLGEASYALYLFHFLFNDWTMDRFGAGHGLIPAVWKLAIVIPVSVLIHIYVERPGRKLILQWWYRHRAANAPA